MDVDVVLLVEVLRQAEGIGAAADVGERGLRRLLHDVAELARQDELALALEHGDFSRQDRTADFGPGHARRDADLRLLLRLRLQELHAAEEVRQVAARHADGRLFALDDLARGLAADLADEALELAHARLARVVLDDVLQHACAEADVLAGEAVLLTLTADEVALCDLELLVLGVARELDDLHAVAQRARDGAEVVGRDDPEDLREVERDVDVVVAERLVLRGVEHLEECRRRVAAVVGRELVDLVEQEDGVARAGVADALDDAARHRADVGAAVAADLGLIAHAAERGADELAPRRARDGCRERRLADARRSDEAEDRRILVGCELVHGEEVEDAFLDLLQAVVVVVEDLGRLLDVDRVLRLLVPRQSEQPFDVVADDARLGVHVVHALEAVELAVHDLLHALGVAADGELRAVLGDVGDDVVLVAELLADDLDLLAQVVVALGLVHLLADLAVDVPLHAQELDLVREVIREQLEAVPDVDALEQVLAHVDLEVQVARDEVGQAPGIVDDGDGDERVGRDALRELDPVLKAVDEGARRDFHIRRGVDRVGVDLGLDLVVILEPVIVADARALLALDEHADRAARQLEDLVDHGDCAVVVEILAPRVVLVGINLADEQDAVVLHHRLLESRQRALAADVEVDDHVGKDHHAAQRQHRQRLHLWRCAFLRGGRCRFVLVPFWCF